MKIETIEEEVEEEKKVDENKLEEEKKKGLIPKKDNGYNFDNYIWTQTAKDVSLYFKISNNVKSKDISVELHPNTISIKIKGIVVLEGELFGIIKVENCTWLINSDDDIRELVVELDKKKFDEWFPHVIKSEPEIDLSKIVPPNANISDLDQETRATINKMMFEQQEKEKQGFYKDLK